jgi:hypothetical protein
LFVMSSEYGILFMVFFKDFHIAYLRFIESFLKDHVLN